MLKCFLHIQWECKAELDSKYQFGRLQVSCEGYEYPDDPYILRGSCGVSGRDVGWGGGVSERGVG